MGEWILAFFGNSIALLTFFSIFAAGMTFTTFNLLFGGDADHGDVHGDFHGGLDGDAHGDFHGDHDADGGGTGPGLLSIRGISFLLTGFGGVAFIVMYFTDKVFVSSLAGLAGGWPFAFVCIALYRVFVRQEASSLVAAKDFVGATGSVVTSKSTETGVPAAPVQALPSKGVTVKVCAPTSRSSGEQPVCLKRYGGPLSWVLRCWSQATGTWPPNSSLTLPGDCDWSR